MTVRMFCLTAVLCGIVFRPTIAADQLFVSPAGNDAWSGSLTSPNAERTDGPFATLEAARDAIRLLKTKCLARWRHRGRISTSGTYERGHAFELSSDDSGTSDNPITYSSTEGQMRLVGGKLVTAWKPVTDAAVLEQLNPLARDKVLQADLKSLGIADFGQVSAGGMELFFNDQSAQVARWPNEGFVKTRDITPEAPSKATGVRERKKWASSITRAMGRIGGKTKPICGCMDTGSGIGATSTSALPRSTSASNSSSLPTQTMAMGTCGAQFIRLNVIAEIDRPGEWQLNRATGVLYFWSPSDIEGAARLFP